MNKKCFLGNCNKKKMITLKAWERNSFILSNWKWIESRKTEKVIKSKSVQKNLIVGKNPKSNSAGLCQTLTTGLHEKTKN